MYIKIIAVIFLILGEVLAIYAEMEGARIFNQNNGGFWETFLKMVLIFLFAGAFLVAGYMLGIKSFTNIWIPTVISILSILIVEPIIAYTFFKQVPTAGAIVGFSFGIIGFLATVIL